MLNPIRIKSDSEAQTQAIGASLVRYLCRGDFLALIGPLGAGKTCFVRGLAKGLGIDPVSVSSPTFVMCQEYPGLSEGDLLRLIHIDAYRIRGPDDLESIGWHELLEADDALIAVEWADRVQAALPEERIEIALSHLGECSREIVISAPPAIRTRIKWNEISTLSSQCCRTCGKPVDQSLPTFPFCSERCRLADLGQWFRETFHQSQPAKSDEKRSD